MNECISTSSYIYFKIDYDLKSLREEENSINIIDAIRLSTGPIEDQHELNAYPIFLFILLETFITTVNRYSV